MTAHVHIGGIEFVTFGLHLIAWLFLLRGVAAFIVGRNPESSIGKGLAYIVG